MPLPRFGKGRTVREDPVAIDDPRFDGWETVADFGDRDTGVAWRDQLRGLGVTAACVAEHTLDRFGRGDIYLVVAPGEWSRATEILENLEMSGESGEHAPHNAMESPDEIARFYDRCTDLDARAARRAWPASRAGRGRSPTSRLRSAGRGGGSPPYSAARRACACCSSPAGGPTGSWTRRHSPRGAGRCGWTSSRPPRCERPQHDELLRAASAAPIGVVPLTRSNACPIVAGSLSTASSTRATSARGIEPRASSRRHRDALGGRLVGEGSGADDRVVESAGRSASSAAALASR